MLYSDSFLSQTLASGLRLRGFFMCTNVKS
nr:MAG TPA: hypothetical protein [Caudoviricetes sp.]